MKTTTLLAIIAVAMQLCAGTTAVGGTAIRETTPFIDQLDKDCQELLSENIMTEDSPAFKYEIDDNQEGWVKCQEEMLNLLYEKLKLKIRLFQKTRGNYHSMSLYDLNELNQMPAKLDESQKKWLEVRETTCSIESDQYLGGTMQIVSYRTCSSIITTARINDLARIYLAMDKKIKEM